MFLPWDDPVGECIDEIQKNFPLASKVDGAYLAVRENVLSAKPYPVKAWMIHKQDPMNALPDQSKTIRMMEQMDFIGVVDVQMSDTAWYADVVFPEHTYLERTDPPEPMGGIVPVVVYRQQVVPPLHDTKHTLDIVQGLAKRMGLSQYFDYSLEQWNAAIAKELPVEAPLDYLKKHGVYVGQGFPKYGTTLTQEHRFITQSGKIELYSDRLAEAKYDPLPVYNPPSQPREGQYRLLVGRRAYLTHASSTNNAWLNAFEPENNLWLNPATARAIGVKTDDKVAVSSTAGSVELKAKVTDEIRPDCVFMLHGYGKRSQWQRLATRGASDAQVLETAWDRVSGNAALHETFVKVRKA
jgi:thiosulfate reductase/polysulfide reductase chain A